MILIKYVSFDIDGVLVNSESRLRLCLRPNNEVDWDCFLDCKKLFMDKPKPRIIDILKQLRNRDFGIIIVTGRRESMRECTINQLRSFGVNEFEELFMRPDNNTDPDPIYKSWTIKSLLRRYEILVHFDDNADTVSTLVSNGIDAVVIS
ncbi:PseT polynucleotide 5'-kinase and 3'-phosphatase [Vulcanisaeta moutnovskia 768-28]|uniref:PseT polynucleotide 5'-kinase and 3'-phosphatase n=1 Tax=Vulcanisaeta moutnovskia (strain 768-28) TaxID=985053 RepID=F0QTE5_VULM7|nr:HAD family acid phosphatase [Vulcanisaeta moutnovskia]ADY00487.1 PseT polynucleotide 5'-kinase and 3'-phosphatase [Vulcanisaeta moutnovskia 768-28]